MTPPKKTSGELLRAWSKAPLPEESLPDEVRRARVTSAMRAALATAQAERIRRQRWTIAAAAAAVLVLVPLAGLLALRVSQAASQPRLVSISGNVFVARTGQARPAKAGAELALADEVGTLAGAGARLEIPGTSTVDLSPSTRLKLEAEGVWLTEGEIYVYVNHLGAKRSFQVETPHATAVVHGTSFLVSVTPAGTTGRTTVAVREGLVVVHWKGEEAMLGPGQSWSSSLEEPPATPPKPLPPDELAPPPTPPAPAPLGIKPEREPAPKAAPRARLPSAPAPTAPPINAGQDSVISQLALQNQLYQQGLAARRRGNEAEAVRFFSELLERFPDSALAEDARQQRAEALQKLEVPPTP